MRISDWSSDVCSSDLGRVLHIDVQLFGRRHEHMAAIRLAPQYGGKEPHHGCPSYRRSFMIPCPVGRDPHAAIAAMLGMPKLDRRQLLLAEQDRKSTRLNSSH